MTVLALLAIPILAVMGHTMYTQRLELVADQHASRYPAQAILLEDAPPGSQKVRGSPATTEVRASWMSASGIRHEGKVPAPYGAAKGTAVDVWLDTNGDLTVPPLTRRDAAAFAIATAIGAWLALVFALVWVYCGVRALLNRARYADWEREWRHISRDSIGK
ncbi:hypothetical protein [Haloechinothrix salitolerans]|uniref:Transmembrane protein n=1 Tax=Haloechinothrix salitolerans TaxID=926830 RepID=A0ABW2C590_9PSEU